MLSHDPPWCAPNCFVFFQGPGHAGFPVVTCTKALRGPKLPEIIPTPAFPRKPSVAPKFPRNSHWIHIKRHAKPHWIPLSSPEISPIFPKVTQNSTESPEIAGNQWGRGSRAICQFPELGLSVLVCRFGAFAIFRDFPDILEGIIQIDPFGLSRPITSTYPEDTFLSN